MNGWIIRSTLLPGTKMTFVGFPKAENRADVIAYLQSLK